MTRSGQVVVGEIYYSFASLIAQGSQVARAGKGEEFIRFMCHHYTITILCEFMMCRGENVHLNSMGMKVLDGHGIKVTEGTLSASNSPSLMTLCRRCGGHFFFFSLVLGSWSKTLSCIASSTGHGDL